MKRPTRRLSDAELREFDELVRAGVLDASIAYRFGLKVADVRRLKAERA